MVQNIGEIKFPKAIQPEEYSTGRGTDDVLYISAVWQGNAPYANGNGEYRKLNLNSVENDWNENCEFAAIRKQLYFLRLPC